MKLSKKIMVAAAAGALGVAAATPAMAFENEFHGMYRAFGYATNAYKQNGAASPANGLTLQKGAQTDAFIEQRARIMYIAKASDDLKLVTHFELNTKFGNAASSGDLDTDATNILTKNLYLDFKIPSTPVRAMVGTQPFNDSFGGLFGNFDAAGASFTAKMNALTATYAYFNVGNEGTTTLTNSDSQDLNLIDLKFAVNKDLTVGGSYYMLLDKPTGKRGTYANNTVGLNAAGKFGPATISGAVGYQFGKQNLTATSNTVQLQTTGTSAMAAQVNAKMPVGPGNVNVAALYLSGDKNGTGYNHAWQPIAQNLTYYTPANMWLITRNAAAIGTSLAVGGNDLSKAGRGTMGLFAGYDGTAGKTFYSANVGAAKVAAKRTAASANIGAEVNATIGYKLYSNLSANMTAAYAFLGDGYGKKTGTLLPSGAADAENPFMGQIGLSYAF
jgi:hypothetical protein